MSPAAISFDPDNYGTYARASAAADYVELAQLNGHPRLVRPRLADWIRDNAWAELFELHFVPFGTPAVTPGPDDAAAYVFDILLQRKEILGPLHPFEVDENSIELGAVTDASKPYLYLLGLATAHTYALPGTSHGPTVFELSVERVLSQRFQAVTAFRRHIGGGDGFPGAAKRATAAVTLPCAEYGADIPVSVHANDEGLDVLAHQPWGDPRPGRWVFVGQATVAKSERWKSKVNEPNVAQWAALITERAEVNGFLAVPHHIQDDHWGELLWAKRVLVDRLRLARWLGDLDPAEEQFVDAITQLEVELVFE
jgi:hypothetical protein